MTTVKKPLNTNAMQEEDRKMVTGMFEFHEVPGGKMEFSYKKYKGEPVLSYKTNQATGQDTALYDGKVYTVPLGVAKHLNQSGSYPVHSYQQNEDGSKVEKIGSKIRRYSFRSMEFMDLGAELTPQIITVESVRG